MKGSTLPFQYLSFSISDKSPASKKGGSKAKRKYFTGEVKNVKLPIPDTEWKKFVQEAWKGPQSFGVYSPVEKVIAIAGSEFKKHNIEFNLLNTLAFIGQYAKTERANRNTLTGAIKRKLEHQEGVVKKKAFSSSVGGPIDKVKELMINGLTPESTLKTMQEWTIEVVSRDSPLVCR